MEHRRRLGDLGEEFAMNLLEEQGYEIMATKYRAKTGEIDIVAQKNRTYHFIEVKTRIGPEYGHPEEAVDAVRQQRMVRTAELYMVRNNLGGIRMQFDVIGIEVSMMMGCI